MWHATKAHTGWQQLVRFSFEFLKISNDFPKGTTSSWRWTVLRSPITRPSSTGTTRPRTSMLLSISMKSPKSEDVQPNQNCSYGKPGDLITLKGEIFTKEYGNANWRDSEGGQDGRREESITGVVVGDRECELTDPLGNVWVDICLRQLYWIPQWNYDLANLADLKVWDVPWRRRRRNLWRRW